MSEAAILARVRIALSRAGAVVFRNNVAKTWVGASYRIARKQQVWVNPGDVVIQNARPIEAGLCVGSSDLIGWKSVLITPDHVGQRLAVFVGCETKHKTIPTRSQRDFLAAVSTAGGIAILARSEEEAVEGLGDAVHRTAG